MASPATKPRPEQRGNLLDQPAEEAPQRPDDDLLDKAIEATASRLDGIAGRYTQAIEHADGHLRRALLTSKGILTLRAALTDDLMRVYIMPLMNSPLGFKTDRPSKSNPNLYTLAEVRDGIIAGLLNGFYPVNNEMNLIAGQFFGALNGWKRKLEEVPGISDIRLTPGVPNMHNGQTVVRIMLEWRLDGARHELRTGNSPGVAFPVSAATGFAAADNLIGKAKRRAYKLAYEMATGSRHTAEEREVGEAPDAQGKVEAAVAGTNGAADRIGPADVKRLKDLAAAAGLADESEFLAMVSEYGGKRSVSELTPAEAAALADRLSIEAQDRQGGE